MLKKKVYYFFHNFLFILSYVHHFPVRRSTFQRQGFLGAYFRSFSHDLHSPERDTTAQACRFSCFFCAAYRLLLTQTRTQCSNSASRAIAMLEKSAKISPNARTVVSLSGECWSCRKLLYFPVFCGILSVAFKSNVHEVRDCRRLMLTSFFSESL